MIIRGLDDIFAADRALVQSLKDMLDNECADCELGSVKWKWSINLYFSIKPLYISSPTEVYATLYILMCGNYRF